MNRGQWSVGTVIRRKDGTGPARMVARISPAGSAGRSTLDGPTFHAAILEADGSARVGGHVADIWAGSLSNPTHDWEETDD